MNPIRTFAAASILESFVIFGSATTLIPNRVARLSARLRLNRNFARALARAIGLRVEGGLPARTPGKNGRIVLANHTSVLDAIALATLDDVIFVTSRDITESLPFRWFATIAGAAFIERRNRDGRTAEIGLLESLLREGRTIVLFPEGTSTDGGEILRFRNGLLVAALRVPGVEIVPTCLRYLTIGGEAVGAHNRDRIFLYADMSVGAHLVRIFSNPEVCVEAEAFAPFRASDFTDAAKLAAHAEFLVRSVYSPIK